MAKKKMTKYLENRVASNKFPKDDLPIIHPLNNYDQHLVLAIRTHSYQTSHKKRAPRYIPKYSR